MEDVVCGIRGLNPNLFLGSLPLFPETITMTPMTITPDLFLSFAKYCILGISVWIVLICMLGVISIRKVGDGAVRPMLQFFAQGDALRMLTVVFLVSATTLLVVLDRIEGEQAATIFSGVAGYVLGSGSRRPDPAKRDEDPNGKGTGTAGQKTPGP
jgi:hypothetical protein